MLGLDVSGLMRPRPGLASRGSYLGAASGGAGGGGWNPATYGSVTAWYDAANDGDITSSGADVTGWADRGPLGSDLTSGATKYPQLGARTINSVVVPEFTGNMVMVNLTPAQYLDASTGAVTMMAVATVDVVSGSNNLISLDAETGNRGPIMRANNSCEALIFTDGSTVIASGTSISNGVTAVFTIVSNGSDTVESWSNNSSNGSDAVAGTPWKDTDPIALGGRAKSPLEGNFDGLLGEAVVWSGALSGVDRQAAELELATKWGIDTAPWA